MDICHRARVFAAGLAALTLSSLASAAPVAVGRDQSVALQDPSIVRVEVLGAENVAPGDPGAVVVDFTGQNACLVYVYEDTATLNQDVRLALFDANDDIVGLPIINVTNAYHNSVDPSCGTVAIPATNTPPVAADDNFGADYAGRNVLSNDFDADGDPITASLVTGPQNGSLTLNQSGTFVYVPDEDFFGTDSFTYRAGDFESLSNVATATLLVPEPVNNAPNAVDDDFGADFADANVLANDSDPDGDALSAVLEQAPGNGTLTLNSSGSFSYSPAPGFVGEVSFSYRASDGELQSSVASVRFVISPEASSPPVAVDDDFADDFDTGNVLDNDLFFNRDTLTVVKVTDPMGGTLQINPDGSYVYRPFAGFTGGDSFTYLIRDQQGRDSNVATVGFNVDGDAAGEEGVTGKQDADGTTVIASASPNELRVSRRIDSICTRLEPDNADQEDLLNLCTNLRSQGTTAKQALVALQALTPEELAAMGKSVRVLSFSRFRNIGARMARVREGGSKGLSLAGLNLRYGDTVVSGDQLDAALEESRKALGMGASGDSEGEGELLAGSRAGLWVRGDLSFGEQDRTGLESGFDFDAQTLTGGLDYRINDNLFVGTSLSVGKTEVDFDANAASTDTDNYALAFYGSVYRGASFMDAVASYGWSDVETERNIVYQDFGGSVNRRAQASTDGNEYYISLNVGHSLDFSGFKFDPLVRFFYLDGEFDGFTETGAGGLDLVVDKQGFESMSLTASGQLSYTLLPSWGVVTPYVRLEYTSEFEDSADGVRYRFANDPFAAAEESLLIDVDDPDSSYFIYGAGVAAQFAYGVSAFVSYQALGSYENLSGEIVSLGMRWEMSF
ncbi:Ig-like domain-containing protein [Haliea sp. E1-2-M8]|uniref:autotransporter family protein n=1 Tax=Haliea sp. E1-2-M8 TaxID=3064706 RepID=UPI0027185B3B|nr:Ig-like domain-containing protein [Haliea sp. E1-2-M8]MDO8860495.1 Ig-like domain-containing protein [Haliea sp. E1-2-M8]